MESTTDIFAQNTMYLISYQCAMPNGTLRLKHQWTKAKDPEDARKQIEDALAKLNYPWFKITKIKKLS